MKVYNSALFFCFIGILDIKASSSEFLNELKESKSLSVAFSIEPKVVTLSVGNNIHEFHIKPDEIAISWKSLDSDKEALKDSEQYEEAFFWHNWLEKRLSDQSKPVQPDLNFTIYTLLKDKKSLQESDIGNTPTYFSQVLKYIFITNNNSIVSIWSQFPGGALDIIKFKEFVGIVFDKIRLSDRDTIYYKNMKSLYAILMHWLLLFEVSGKKIMGQTGSFAVSISSFLPKDTGIKKNNFEQSLLLNMKEALELQCKLKEIPVVKDGVNLIDRIENFPKLKEVLEFLQSHNEFPENLVTQLIAENEQPKSTDWKKYIKNTLKIGVIGIPITFFIYFLYQRFGKKR
jgi:hypothetical protein